MLSYERAELIEYGAEVQYELTLTNYEVEHIRKYGFAFEGKKVLIG